MFSPPVTAAFVLGAVIFSVYYYFKSSSGAHQQQYEYRRSHNNSPGYPPDPGYFRERVSSYGSSEDSDCTICIGTTRGRFEQVSCGHTFHSRCIRDWFKKGTNSCPVCRSWLQ